MREIKFRAEYQGEIFQVENIYFEDGLISIFKESVYGEVFQVKLSEVNLLQYTGLKDKNDKEIYEGNIVNYSKHPAGKATVEWNKEGYFELVFPSGARNFIPQKSLHNLYGFEIIGNIYENPELLTNPELEAYNDVMGNRD